MHVGMHATSVLKDLTITCASTYGDVPMCLQASQELQDAALGLYDQDTGSYPLSDVQVTDSASDPDSAVVIGQCQLPRE